MIDETYIDVPIQGAFIRKDSQGNPSAIVMQDINGDVYISPYTGNRLIYDPLLGGSQVLVEPTPPVEVSKNE